MTNAEIGLGISVVIPTHNRRQLLGRVMDALARQTADPAMFEVVVVPDGCTDGTEDMLRAQRYPFVLKLVEQSGGGGPAAARNAGAKAAAGRLLLFLDDDVEPSLHCVEAHRRAHELEDGAAAVLGPYPPAPHASANLFRLIIRNWWKKHFEDLAEKGHRFSFRDLLTGNLSLPAHVWEHLGGLDPSFRAAHEDYELGVRLMQLRIPFRFVPDAGAYHHEYETMTVAGAFRRAREEGRSDVLLGRKHPHVRSGLRITALMARSSGVRVWFDRLIFALGHRTDPFAHAMASVLEFLDRTRLRDAYIVLYRELNEYWYLRGAAEILKSWSAWKHFELSAPPPGAARRLNVDLKGGIPAAEEAIDQARPDEVTLHYGGRELGVLPREPGAEAWQGRHLRPLLCGHLARAYLECLLKAGDLEGVPPACRSAVERGLSKAGLAIASPREEMWWEQDGQWRVFIAEAGD
jgi:GT2 family glycosyltransferase